MHTRMCICVYLLWMKIASLCVCVCVCVCIYIYIYIYIYNKYAYTHVYMCVLTLDENQIWTSISVCLSQNDRWELSSKSCKHMYVCMYVCIVSQNGYANMCMYISCVCTYVHTFCCCQHNTYINMCVCVCGFIHALYMYYT